MDKNFENQLFESRRSWMAGNHSDDNLWANWKFEQAEMVESPHCGNFDYWDSLAPKNSELSQIERKVGWAEIVLWYVNLKPSYTVVNGHVRNGTYVNSHLRKI